MAKTDPQRLVDLKAALKSAKATDMLSLGDCSIIWGVTKPRFVNKAKEFSDFPDPVRDGNSHLYEARAALKSMIGFIERHQQASLERAQRTGKLLGGMATEESLLRHTPQELVVLNRLQTELAKREIEQGNYVPRAEVEQIAGQVFSEVSELLNQLSNRIDPHGKLEPAIRVMIDTMGSKRLLEIHTRLKGLLTDHADNGTNSGKAGKPRQASTRRKR